MMCSESKSKQRTFQEESIGDDCARGRDGLPESSGSSGGSWRLRQLGLVRDGSRVLIVGLGKTGLSSAFFLARHGIPFAVVDSRRQPPGLADLTAQLPDVPVYFGDFTAAAFEGPTHCLVSPGVPLAVPEIQQAQRAGTVLISDIDLFACMAQAPVVAITGSNGKSTVTTLLGFMAQKAGLRVKVGGNLGTPALDLLDGNEPDCYVLELSSFQLERTSWLQPAAATVLNVTPDHMDRYRDIDAYAQQKQRIFNGQGTMVLNVDDPIVANMAVADRHCVRYGLSRADDPDFGVSVIGGEEWLFHRDRRLVRSDSLRLTGRHNVSNALAALALGDAMGFPLDAMCQALREFAGLDHRMQWVAELSGVTWINDSKATNVGACRAALEGIRGQSVLIAGGDGKGADFSELRSIIIEKVRAAVLIGRDADFFARMLSGAVVTAKADTMSCAVQRAHALAKAGDTVLLSPACASLDQYADYQARGQAFIDAVGKLVKHEE